MKYVRVKDVEKEREREKERMKFICTWRSMVYKHIKNHRRNTRLPREKMRETIRQKVYRLSCVRVSAHRHDGRLFLYFITIQAAACLSFFLSSHSV